MPKVPEKYAQERAREVLAAAAACFARAGYRGASMGDIAREAGLSVGALYRYFPDKEALFVALVKAARESDEALWAEIGRTGGAAEQLTAFLDRYIDSLRDPHCRPSLMISMRLRAEALDHPLIRRELLRSYRFQLDKLRSLFARLAAPNAARMPKPTPAADAAAHALIGLLNEAGFLTLVDPEWDPAPFWKTVRGLIDRVV